MWTPRTTPVKEGDKPFVWGIDSVFECTWFCYYEALFHNLSAPCYWDRPTKTGSYTNAKEWLKNYREPWEVKGLDYTPVAGDIAVYDGDLGHVIFYETDTMTAEYRSGDPNSFRIGKAGEYNGVLLGYLHYPYAPIDTVSRDVNKDQVQTTDDTLRIRIAPSLDAEVVGYVDIGYYNVLATKNADNYTWYKIAKDRWIANVTTKYLPKDEEGDIIAQIKEYFDRAEEKVKAVTDENEKLKDNMRKIHELSNV